jgi:hypothetical protein
LIIGNHRIAAEPRFTWAGTTIRVFILILDDVSIFGLALPTPKGFLTITPGRPRDQYIGECLAVAARRADGLELFKARNFSVEWLQKASGGTTRPVRLAGQSGEEVGDKTDLS